MFSVRLSIGVKLSGTLLISLMNLYIKILKLSVICSYVLNVIAIIVSENPAMKTIIVVVHS